MGAHPSEKENVPFLSHSIPVVEAFRHCPHHRQHLLLLPLCGDQEEEEHYLKGEGTGKGRGQEERTFFKFPSPLTFVECVVDSVRHCNRREKKNTN